MDERRFSEQLRRSLDGEPRPGAFERLQASLGQREPGPRRLPAFAASLIAGALAVAIVATLVAVRWPRPDVSPAAAPPPPLPAVTATKAVVMVDFVETPEAWWLLVADTQANAILYRSTDAGKHWTATSTTRQEIWIPPLNGGGLTQPDLIVATQDGPRTTRDGVNWTTPPLPQGWSIQGPFYFPNGRDGWAIGTHGSRGTAAILRTSDGGATWTADPPPAPGNGLFPQILYNAVFFDPLTGWITSNGEHVVDGQVAGYSSDAFVTHDGGQTWIASQLPAGTTDIAGAFVAGPNGVLAASNHSGRLRFARSTDGGLHWSDTGISAPGDSADLLGQTSWLTWTRGGDVVSVTTNGGRTVVSRAVPLPAGSTSGVVSVRATDARHWLVDVSDSPAGAPTAGHHVLLLTSDGGATWTQVQIPG
jgi:hypothetical protein